MSVIFNPFTGNLDFNDTTKAAGSDTQVQFNDGGKLGGDSGLVFNKTTNKLTAGGDVELNDGGSFTTTLQTVTPTANRTISFPDATGTVGLVAGSSGQLVYNNAGAYAGVPSSAIGATGDVTLALNGAASTPPLDVTGTWFTGGTSTTTKPQVLIEPAGTTSTAWSTSGTGLGVNAASGFAGNLLDLQVNGTSQLSASSAGALRFTTGSKISTKVQLSTGSAAGLYARAGTILCASDGTTEGFQASLSGVLVRSSAEYSWSSGDPDTGGGDVRLFRDAAGILAQRNGTNAQTFRVYNTYTDASNYERGFLRWSSNVFEVGPEAAGTGTARPMRITAATLKLPNLPTYADNAAATTGGLVAGDVYKTAAGELRITV